MLIVICKLLLYIPYKSKIYAKLDYAYRHTFSFPESHLGDTYRWFPSGAPPALPTRPTESAAASRPLGQVRSWWAQGSTWKLQAKGKESQCLHWGLASEWPLSAQGLYLFSNQPNAFDPILKSKDRKKGPFLSWGLATWLGWGRTSGRCEGLAQDLPEPRNDSSC